MAESKVVKQPVYKIGLVNFTIKNLDVKFEAEVDALLPRSYDTNLKQDEIHEISTGCSQDVVGLLNYILRRHSKCIWISASCLISPHGHKILIVGPSFSGKSTLSMGLALGYDWKVVGEDVVLLDLESLQVVPVAIPFFVRPDSMALLEEVLGKSAEPPLKEGWYSLGKRVAHDGGDANFDAVVFLDRWTPKMKVETLQPGEGLRKIIELSNIIRRKGSVDSIMGLLSSSRCVNLRGGTLQQRLEAVLNICR